MPRAGLPGRAVPAILRSRYDWRCVFNEQDCDERLGNRLPRRCPGARRLPLRRRSRWACCCRPRACTPGWATTRRWRWNWASTSSDARWPGREIELVYADSEAKPSTGLAQIKKLVLRDRVDVVVGIISSAVARRGARLHPQRGGSAGDHQRRQRPRDRRAVQPVDHAQLVLQCADQPGDGPVDGGPRATDNVFLMAFDYAAGHQAMDAFRGGFLAAGGTIAGEEYPPLSAETEDFGPYLAKIRAARPRRRLRVLPPAVRRSSSSRSGPRSGCTARCNWPARAGSTRPCTSTPRGGRCGRHARYSQLRAVDRHGARTRCFRSAFQAAHGRAGSEFGVAAYDTARLIVAALQATGGNTDDKAALAAAMRATTFDGPRGPFRIDPATNNVIQNVYIFEVQKQGDGVAARGAGGDSARPGCPQRLLAVGPAGAAASVGAARRGARERAECCSTPAS